MMKLYQIVSCFLFYKCDKKYIINTNIEKIVKKKKIKTYKLQLKAKTVIKFDIFKQ